MNYKHGKFIYVKCQGQTPIDVRFGESRAEFGSFQPLRSESDPGAGSDGLPPGPI